jgi:hypothetical protein
MYVTCGLNRKSKLAPSNKGDIALLAQAAANNDKDDAAYDQLTRIMAFLHTKRIEASENVQLEKHIYASYAPDNTDNDNKTIKQKSTNGKLVFTRDWIANNNRLPKETETVKI